MNELSENRFWERLSLAEMSDAQWEALCDGCGRCCLHKLEDEDTGELRFTAVSCRELDLNNVRCKHYADRATRVPGCLVLSPEMSEDVYRWLPASCAYRLIHQGQPLASWHPLLTGKRNSVRTAGVSVSLFAISELKVRDADLEDYCVEL